MNKNKNLVAFFNGVLSNMAKNNCLAATSGQRKKDSVYLPEPIPNSNDGVFLIVP